MARVVNAGERSRQDHIAVPHDLLPYDYAARFSRLVLRERDEGEPEAVAPAGLHMAGEIVRNRVLICLNRHPVEFLVAASNITEDDFDQVTAIIDKVGEAFAWDVVAFNYLQE